MLKPVSNKKSLGPLYTFQRNKNAQMYKIYLQNVFGKKFLANLLFVNPEIISSCQDLNIIYSFKVFKLIS